MIPGDLLSAFPHRQFHTLPGLLDSWAALPNSNPNTCMPMQGGSLYHFYDGLWYDRARGGHATDWANPTRSWSHGCMTRGQLPPPDTGVIFVCTRHPTDCISRGLFNIYNRRQNEENSRLYWSSDSIMYIWDTLENSRQNNCRLLNKPLISVQYSNCLHIL